MSPENSTFENGHNIPAAPRPTAFPQDTGSDEISAPAAPPRIAARTLWVGVALGFSLLFVAWTILFTLVSRNRVTEVPLATPSVHR